MKASYQKYILDFKRPSGTSRGVMTEKETWFVILEKEGMRGIGECGILRLLSVDDRPNYEEKLKWACENIHLGEQKLWEELIEFPSIQFGIEMAFRSLEGNTPYDLFPSDFTKGKANIPINGLVWMGDEAYMKEQIEDKLQMGFKCIKLKIGAIDFDTELSLLRFIRANFSPEQIEIRVDANGAFNLNDALSKLKQLSEFELHSIEQPIAKNQTDSMAALCKNTPLPIALDEELIGVFNHSEKDALLQKTQPQYIILKPSLVGGFRGCAEWIALAEKYNIGWWVTSALESNIGLNAIAQWTFLQNNPMPQGLGTGALYTNNFESSLEVKNGELCYNPNLKWEVNL
ncbi:o-succinylbenzoate synthase [Flavobacterium zepuense]|uniref:O-succinylbenzoate synthase n=1 Tax=Flavobacterium zepuense TaxID=2593302 RepID=A0A552V5L7_9FLAO|nr:o-succinylbenzoate synthase [Flavobacterium zepuense]TRW25747.1 o-succinylbenzoate synthase [Flavobacterium zepuense]